MTDENMTSDDEAAGGFLGRDAILDADDRKYDAVDCPEWGGKVRVRSLTGTQRDAYEGSLIEGRGADRKMNLANARAKMVVLAVVDGEGRQLFTADDVRALGRKNAAPIERIFDAARRLSGMSEEDVEKLTENFGDDPNDEGTSA
jgi:hypothetical protein